MISNTMGVFVYLLEPCFFVRNGSLMIWNMIVLLSLKITFMLGLTAFIYDITLTLSQTMI